MKQRQKYRLKLNDMKKFNINHSMYIQITKEGWKHLKKTVGEDYIKHSITPYKIEIDGETWYKLSCWTVFELLPVSLGMNPLFKPTVMFNEKDMGNPIVNKQPVTVSKEVSKCKEEIKEIKADIFTAIKSEGDIIILIDDLYHKTLELGRLEKEVKQI